MGRLGVMAAAVAVATAGVTLIGGPAARAANSPTFRDCSAFVEGFDPDFVEIAGVAVSPSGSLSVTNSQNAVQLTASESSDPGDSNGHVTLTATVTTPGVPSRTASGAATGRVTIQVPLVASRVGRTYTIACSATFDNGNHACPSTATPDNTPSDPHPFVIEVTRRS